MKFHVSLIGFLLFIALIVGSSCTRNDSVIEPNTNTNDTTNEILSLSKVGKGGQIWADCELFGTIGTPAHFKPESGPFDELYNTNPDVTGATFKDGVAAISESKPGDQDFNGGRWHVNLLKDTVDPNKYSNECSVDNLDPNDFEPTNVYFECPLLPRRGNN